MAKDKLTDYDSTASGNLDVGGISVAEGMLPSGVNNAIRELMSHQADAFGAGTPLYVDQTNNRLGINQASPAHPLHVGTDDLIVDASGNVLVGKTAVNSNAAGFEAESDGKIAATRDGSRTAIFNRLTSDGEIVAFRKDGSTVGSIGTASGGVSLGSGDTGLYFEPVSNEIRPFNTTTNASIDNAINLGNSTKRFKDLYLSGGVYLGGTGSANLLDDYEEGSLSLSVATGTASFAYARYTKVGNLVTIRFQMLTISDQSSTSNLLVTGLPFTSRSSNQSASGILSRYFNGGGDAYVAYISANATQVQFFQTVNNGNYHQVRHVDLTNTNANAFVTISYETS